MIEHAATAPGSDADARWRAWEARGAEHDRRTAARIRRLALLIAIALLVWFVVRLV
jgi:hypothetical protein